ncbi:cobalamin biosynthesis protein [Paenibacillus sp. HN-1]|uniref:cobalt-precorrin 5A hydrolase n=1 Tax=Paenibacillus TaxID=44249 RepID=UPI001CA97A2D|nr:MULTISPECIES: cobalamin biosynthesis protein [Paenibacillus]MBY9078147.1 cobalamin biosynthesis protein [Paenibacillus sp. CGMCC 1.18879]MBY9083888.1 cobalamin biosynthesis protein [Paenibacillus sinensis]
MSKRYAAVAITKHGVETARRLAEAFRDTDVFAPGKFARGDEAPLGITLFEGPVKPLLAQLFSTYNGLILFISLGAAVRMIAPLLEDKTRDPAIVVADELGLHAISMLSGHLGGGNELTLKVAEALGAHPVITTASDVQGTIAVDLFGRRFGWEIENFGKTTTVSASVINEERIAVIQEAGEPSWWERDNPLPSNITSYRSALDAMEAGFDAALVVTDRLLEQEEEQALLGNGILYRPKSLILGIGCNRGTSAEEIEQTVLSSLAELRLSVKSVRGAATIDLKKNEQGLLDVCRKYGWTLDFYNPEQLNEIPLRNPSETVYRHTGAYGVSEPAALRASGASDWLLEKKKQGNVTLSIARIPVSTPESVSGLPRYERCDEEGGGRT